MPYRPKKACSYFQCPNLTDGRYCPEHEKLYKQKLQKMKSIYDKQRGSASKRGYDYKWQKARKQFLNEYPLCVNCLKEGLTVIADVVDHIKPHKGDKELFWNRSNWQSLCKSCHDRKSAKEDGGGWRKQN